MNSARIGSFSIPPNKDDEGESFWKVWLTRILVTIAIALLFEYIGKQPVPQVQAKEDEEEKFVTMQYTELQSDTDAGPDSRKEDAVKQETSTADETVPKQPTEPKDAKDDEEELYDKLEGEEDKAKDENSKKKIKTKESTKNINTNTNSTAQAETVSASPSGATSTAAGGLEAFRNHPQLNQLRRLVQTNPKMLQTVLAQIGQQQPELLEAINADQAAFLAVINQPATDDTTPSTSTPSTEAPSKTLQFKNKVNCHPGMEGYHHWYDIETSLFRQYNVGRTDGVDVIPPYVPKSRNGQVRVALRVTNHYAMRVNVYWINYQGHEDFKGTILRGETWHQTTWLEHPWVFRLAPDGDGAMHSTNDDEQEPLLLHYIPERVIPHLDEAPTIEDQHPMVGVQRFSIRAPIDQALRENFICSIDDPIMPHPANHHFHNPHQAHNWTLVHMKRQAYFDYHPGATVITKYLTNIAMNPAKAQYRQLRIANKTFATEIWNTPARGLLLAAGFKEQHAYAELGTADPLSNELVQDVSLALYRLEQCLIELGQSASSTQQPDGADGQGRAGFRRL